MKGDSGTWICSNLVKHINNRHIKKMESKNSGIVKDNKHNRKSPTCEVENDIQTDEQIQTINSSSDFGNRSSLVALEIDPITTDHSYNIIELNTMDDDLKCLFYKQLSKQNIEMTNACMINKESTAAFYGEYDLADEQKHCIDVNCCRINGDGDCMFGSITHQLFCDKINSPDYVKSTMNLRQKTVSYIRNNIEIFIQYLKDRVYTEHEENGNLVRAANKIGNIQAECIHFLDTQLIDKNKAWGGTESLVAISEIEHVNILIINDDGSCNMVQDFNNNYTRSIAVCYNRRIRHYGSVDAMNEDTMFTFIESILTTQNLRKKGKERENIIEIDD